jgi:hypothetical protein
MRENDGGGEHVWKHHNKTLIVQLIYTNKHVFKGSHVAPYNVKNNVEKR